MIKMRLISVYFTVVVMTLIVPHNLMAQSVCDQYSYSPSSEAQRVGLLSKAKAHLIGEARNAIFSLKDVKKDLEDCNDETCREFSQFFLEHIREQYELAKIARAIAERPKALLGKARSPRNVGHVLLRIESGNLHAQQIANLNINGMNFSNDIRNKIVEMWVHVFVRTANKKPNANLAEIIEMVREYFEIVSENLNKTNPLLAFLDDSSMRSSFPLIEAIDHLIQFNQEFIETTQGLQTHHSKSFWSYPNLTLKDHEMGLINFPTQIEKVISKESNKNVQKTLCYAWNDLQNQQKKRVRSSIGVGFATSVVCGVGIWSGFATVPALIACAPAIADGLWGARRGLLDSRLAAQSEIAGQKLNESGIFSEGILSAIDSLSQQRRANFVFLVNAIGVLPVAKAVIFAKGGAKGSFISLFTLPSNDVAVSIAESSAANVVYLIMALRGAEAIQVEYEEEFDDLFGIWENTNMWQN